MEAEKTYTVAELTEKIKFLKKEFDSLCLRFRIIENNLIYNVEKSDYNWDSRSKQEHDKIAAQKDLLWKEIRSLKKIRESLHADLILENGKYYVPGISEFYPGFWFEFKREIEDEWEQVCLEVEDLQTHHSGSVSDYNPFMNHPEVDSVHYYFRVKYLDREDIESLGWRRDSVYSYRFGEDWILEISEEGLVKQDDIDIYCVCDPRFVGKIKNKSELKKIMQMLSITE